MEKLFYFAVGFVLGFFFLIIINRIKKHIYIRSKRLKRKAFNEQMDKLNS